MELKESRLISAVSRSLLSHSFSQDFYSMERTKVILLVFFQPLQRDFGDKRVFSERRRNDSYAEEEPEWFSGGPTSQSETIELIGFDDKILEDDKRRSKRSRRRAESSWATRSPSRSCKAT